MVKKFSEEVYAFQDDLKITSNNNNTHNNINETLFSLSANLMLTHSDKQVFHDDKFQDQNEIDEFERIQEKIALMQAEKKAELERDKHERSQ